MLERIFDGLTTAALTMMVVYGLWSYVKVLHAKKEDEFQESLEASDGVACRYQKTYREEEVGHLPWMCDEEGPIDQAESQEKDEADWWKES